MPYLLTMGGMVRNVKLEDKYRQQNEFIPRQMGARGSIVVKALCYKLEGRGFETR
jgi:hypothetical protein